MTGILIVIGLLLIGLNFRAVQKERKSFDYTLQYTEEQMEEIDVKIGAVRKEFAETIIELQAEILDLKEKLQEKESAKRESVQEEIMKVEKQVIEEDVFPRRGSYIEVPKEETKQAVPSAIVVEALEQEVLKPKAQVEIEQKSQEEAPMNEESNMNNVKIKEMKELFKQGYSIEQIAEQLNLGKGEVLLIKELYLK